jgi:hypothetical protein
MELRGGLSTIRADWLARAAGLGEDVRVRLADRELTGRFEALDEAGSLVLRLPTASARPSRPATCSCSAAPPQGELIGTIDGAPPTNSFSRRSAGSARSA